MLSCQSGAGRSKSGPSLGWGPLQGGVPAWFLVSGRDRGGFPHSGRSFTSWVSTLIAARLRPWGTYRQALTSHLVGVILGYGGWPWASQAQGTMLQKSLVYPGWAPLLLSLSWAPILGLISGGPSGHCS